MLIVMKDNATALDVERVQSLIEGAGATSACYRPQEALVAVTSGKGRLEPALLETLPGVSTVRCRDSGYWLASRARQAADTVVEISGRRIGGQNDPLLIAGPCAVESEDQLARTAEAVLEAGADMLRGGAFKPRSSPYSFQGLGEQGLELLARIRQRYDLPIVVEMRDAATVDLFRQYEVDLIQLGARNMQNFEILRTAAAAGRPLLLKRGPSNSVDEWLSAAEYLLLAGNPNVVLCERGIVPPVGSKTRYLLDIAAVPVVKELSHLPVIVDPSHAAGAREYVSALAAASLAVGADGLLVEAHHDPDNALCDGSQSLTPAMLEEMVAAVRGHGYAVGARRAAPLSVAWSGP